MLRYRNWLIPLLAVTAVVVGSLLDLGQWFPEQLIGDITNALHYPSGILLALIIGPQVRQWRWLSWCVWGGSLILFAVIEVAQPYFGRSCTFSDWLQSSTGMTLGMLLAQLTPQSPVYMRRVLVRLGLLLLIAFTIPLFYKIQTLDAHESKFPVLFTFEDESELLLWKRYGTFMEQLPLGGIAQEFQLSDQHFARIKYGDIPYPAVAYVAAKRDWRGYRKLCFDSRGDQQGQILRFKLRDVAVKKQDVDLRWQFDNPPHWHSNCVSLEGLRRKTGEPFDLSTVHSLQIIGGVRKEGGWFDINNVRLVQ